MTTGHFLEAENLELHSEGCSWPQMQWTDDFFVIFPSNHVSHVSDCGFDFALEDRYPEFTRGDYRRTEQRGHKFEETRMEISCMFE